MCSSISRSRCAWISSSSRRSRRSRSKISSNRSHAVRSASLGHSCRSAVTGSSREARCAPAGPRRPSRWRPGTTATPARAIGLLALHVDQRASAARCRRATAPVRPIARPIETCRSARRRNSHDTCDRCAPSAMRTPTSWVRCVAAVRGQRVESERREHRGDHRDDRERRARDALDPARIVRHALERLQVEERQIGIECAGPPAARSGEALRVAANDQRGDRRRCWVSMRHIHHRRLAGGNLLAQRRGDADDRDALRRG